ncbi:hypothetical protein OG535_05590 [Kitasatospora sp. NBC_00085]|uniref:hypothetical protein n=1 Tax=unclassified Kitasatospora TaxID=2633591 RepID=UPI0032540894
MKVRQVAERRFAGNASIALQIVVAADRPVTDPAVQRVITKAEAVAAADPRICTVVPPQPGATISQDGRNAILLAGSAAAQQPRQEAAALGRAPVAAAAVGLANSGKHLVDVHAAPRVGGLAAGAARGTSAHGRTPRDQSEEGRSLLFQYTRRGIFGCRMSGGEVTTS